ncbi:hypothetical protein L1987_44308 [Smallanthus sonchifolius]|uniref:Uncharacterized protein n=1 Tax=Smallanthus sonchifolius TaxID=185202 RepID=A0ACB9GP28_9ASTR|nr:hypothetical protein L1987_44308 [Smallanthus sonchifolius]
MRGLEKEQHSKSCIIIKQVKGLFYKLAIAVVLLIASILYFVYFFNSYSSTFGTSSEVILSNLFLDETLILILLRLLHCNYLSLNFKYEVRQWRSGPEKVVVWPGEGGGQRWPFVPEKVMVCD